MYISSFFFFKQKTAYEMRISDWSSDVCSSDLFDAALVAVVGLVMRAVQPALESPERIAGARLLDLDHVGAQVGQQHAGRRAGNERALQLGRASCRERVCQFVKIEVGAVSFKNKQ